jgi:hypothetical protein
MSETVTCHRCGTQSRVESDGGQTQVPPGWKRVVISVAGPGTWIGEDDLAGHEPQVGYWLCPAHHAI